MKKISSIIIGTLIIQLAASAQVAGQPGTKTLRDKKLQHYPLIYPELVLLTEMEEGDPKMLYWPFNSKSNSTLPSAYPGNEQDMQSQPANSLPLHRSVML